MNVSLWTVFTTGLITGGLACMAVQGGLLASSIAQKEQERLTAKAKTGRALPILSFLIAKIIAYTIFGFFLGWLGSVLSLTIQSRAILMLVVSLFMIGTALNLLQVHPFFRYFALQPPRFITKFIRKESKNNHLFGPAVLGALTIFIPCGTTQAFIALAVASANPVYGALILLVFTLGTSPLFFLLGYLTTKLSDVFNKNFTKVAAIFILLFALFNINNASALLGGATFENIWKNIYCTGFTICTDSQLLANNQKVTNNATLTIQSEGYTPDNLVVKAGSNVTLNLVNQSGNGCTQSFTIPSLGIEKVVPIGNSSSVSFTAPSKPGVLSFMCSMGMYRGTIHVI